MRRKGIISADLIIFIIVGCLVGLFFIWQMTIFSARDRDQERKLDINQLFQTLSVINKTRDGFYPISITPETMAGLDTQYLTDPTGRMIGDARSDYTYIPTDCNDTKCGGFTLRADLEKEADLVRSSEN